MKNITMTVLLACVAIWIGYYTLNKFIEYPDPIDRINYLIPQELTSFVEGGNDAEIKIYNFFDYSCTYCKETERILSKLQEEFGGQFQINHAPIPLAGKNSATYRATALSICYYQQNENIKFHKYLVENQKKLEATLNLDSSNFQFRDSSSIEEVSKCVEGNAYLEKLNINKKIASEMGISSVPATIIEGEIYVGLLRERDYRNLIKKHVGN